MPVVYVALALVSAAFAGVEWENPTNFRLSPTDGYAITKAGMRLRSLQLVTCSGTKVDIRLDQDVDLVEGAVLPTPAGCYEYARLIPGSPLLLDGDLAGEVALPPIEFGPLGPSDTALWLNLPEWEWLDSLFGALAWWTMPGHPMHDPLAQAIHGD